jgi:hypothetical protein
MVRVLLFVSMVIPAQLINPQLRFFSYLEITTSFSFRICVGEIIGAYTAICEVSSAKLY